jgi:hypothetical protein
MTDIRDNVGSAISKGGYIKSRVAEAMGLTPQQLSDVLAHRRKLEANEFLLFCDFVRLAPSEVASINSTTDE